MGSKQVQLANDIIGEIIQKVGKQEYASKSYSNPLADLKRDFINSATKIEEIYVERALAQEPDPTGADTLYEKNSFAVICFNGIALERI